MRDVDETGSDRRTDYDSALDFRTAKDAQAWIARNGEALGLHNLREYSVGMSISVFPATGSGSGTARRQKRYNR